MAGDRQAAALEGFSPATRAWFSERYPRGPTRVQALGWPAIAAGRHALLCAPTGSGKTLAAFLSALDRLATGATDGGGEPPGTRVVYVSPLKALAYDVERNLSAPLAQIARLAGERGLAFAPPSIGVRTGDTSAAARRRQLREPPDLLITTPESLYLLLTSSARAGLAAVETVIVDEIHALAPNKRGAHLALSLERLAALARREPQRVGLSATQRPLEEVARYLGGDRAVDIIDAGETPRLELSIEVPVADLTQPAGAEPDIERRLSPEERASVMPAVYRRVHDLVAEHQSTIVFVNSRRLAERVAHEVNQLAGAELARAHHGSVARPERLEVEDLLARGLLRCIVATSSLELGIDMAAVDLVVQLESPGSVARGLQRIGRAGHAVGVTSRGRLVALHRGDLLEAATVARGMGEGAVEPIRVPEKPLDVLAQQVVAMVATENWPVEKLAQVIRRAHAYRDLSPGAFAAVLDMLSGAWSEGGLADLPARLAWDKVAGEVSARRGARMVALTNGGTIPDRGLYAVHVGAADGPRVGELDEEMVYESRPGDVFLLGATSWRVQEIARDRVIVTPAPGEPGRMPFWHGDRPGRPAALGRAMGQLVEELAAASDDEARALLAARHQVDRQAADNLLAYLRDQRDATGTLPGAGAVTVERFPDQVGDVRVCVLSPLGTPVHAPWAIAVEAALGERLGMPIQSMWTDDGIAFRLPAGERSMSLDLAGLLALDPDEVEDRVTRALSDSALFATHFRDNAARALLLTRRHPGARTPLWVQRLRSQQLLGAALGQPRFPVVLETYRELLRDVFDLPALTEHLRQIRRGQVRIDVVDTPAASPFARSLVFAYTMAFLYEGDAPLAERRAQALTLDRGLLRQLLGQEDLSALLDPEVMAEVERERQRLAPERRARDADEVHDLLRRLGDLSPAEVAARSEDGAETGRWIATLERQGRAARIDVAGEERLVAAGDQDRYRAALAGGDDEALAELMARRARQLGPLRPADLAGRFGVGIVRARAAIDALEARGELERGGFTGRVTARPGQGDGAATESAGGEVVHAEVLRELQRRTLARLRSQVEPVAPAALGRFLPAWHRIGAGAGRTGGPAALREAIRRLAGYAVPLAELESRILPARVADYRPAILDELGARGEVVWVGAGGGAGSAGPVPGGRIALFDREHLALLEAAETDPGADPRAGDGTGRATAARDPAQAAVLAALAAQGASFQLELEDATGLGADELSAALWPLVWAGLVTNDTLAPLRSRAWRSAGRRTRTPAQGRRRAARASHYAGGGRWSLVSQRARVRASATERALTWAQCLLDRYGVVSREAILSEDLPGGYTALAPVLRVLEETGRVRRGYFVAGLDGRQVALPAALDRLRAPADAPAAQVLSAVDPANPYGALVPWPATRNPQGPRPTRRAGALLILWGGEAALYAESGGRSLSSFPAVAPDALADCLAQALPVVARLLGRRALRVESVDGQPARQSDLAPLLLAAGFRSELRGLSFER